MQKIKEIIKEEQELIAEKVKSKEKLFNRLESSDFDNFRSNLCHYLKNVGDLDFIYAILESDIITLFCDKQMYEEALYTLAALDCISKENEIPICTRYEYLRCCKFKQTIFPSQAEIVCRLMKNNSFKERLLKNANPEFLKYNIVEGDMRDVC